MTANRTAPFFSRLTASEESDADLVRRYATARDAAAFESLVRRYGPLVFAVCRRALGREHDAEDAFQAAFLVLAQKAGRIREPHLLSAWLYGVAVRVANKAKSRASRRREESRGDVPERASIETERDAELGPLIDAELAALPEWYRQAVLLCDVQELSRTEAAARLGIPEGTLSSRLAVGRKRLAARLARRGVVLSVPALASVAAAVPEKLIQQTLETATAWAAGGPVANPILELTREGMTMVRKMWMLGCGVATATIFGFGLAGDPEKPIPKPDAKPVALVAAVAVAETKFAAPRQRGILSVSARYDTMRWSVDGKRMVLSGIDRRAPATDFGTVQSTGQLIQVSESGMRPLGGFSGGIMGTVIGVHPKEDHAVIVHLEESGGINVQNKILAHKIPALITGEKKVLSEVDLTDTAQHEPVLSSNGRTILFTSFDEATKTTEVREIDFTTGKVERPAFRTTEDLLAIAPDGSSAVTAVTYSKKVTVEAGAPPREAVDHYIRELNVWNCQANQKRWSWKPPGEVSRFDAGALFSRDAKTFAIYRGDSVLVFDAISGREVQRYAATDKRAITDVHLSHDGRLTVLQEYRLPEPAAGAAGDSGGLAIASGPPQSRPTQYVSIFDNSTGKAIKKWETQLAVTLAFAPDRPTLAVLERPMPVNAGMGMPGGMMGPAAGGTAGTGRLGLWEFATVEK